jgi:HEPN domain-containing protein
VLDEEEYQRWMDSAKQTLDSAKVDLDSGFYNWACFKSQQSAELAVKAYLYGIGQPKAGHSIAYLLSLIEAPQEIIEKGKYLDKLYIPTRYPDAWSSGSPSFYYTRKEAEDAIKYAEDIIKFLKEEWRKTSSKGE